MNTRRSFFKQCAAAVAICYGVRFKAPEVEKSPWDEEAFFRSNTGPVAWHDEDGRLMVRPDTWADLMGTDQPNRRAILTDIQV